MKDAELADENQMQLTDIDSLGNTDSETDSDTDGDSEIDKCCVIVHQPTRKELARSVRSCLAHANQIVSAGTIDSATRADAGHKIASGKIDLPDRAVPIDVGGIALGIDAERRHVVNGVSVSEKTDDIRHVVVDSIGTLGKDHAEIRDRVETLVNGGVTLHLNDTAVEIDSDSADAVLGVLDSLDKGGVELQRAAGIRDVRDWADGIDRDRGRAPLGFEYVDGELVTAANYDEVRAVLSMARAGPDGDRELSKRKAAERLDVAPRTIGRALDNLDRYGLEEEGEDTEE
ncbi:hypothetical protein M0R88_03045 [Halorussus gelatinilyticus]|uniref:Uncharacterized protein n=1 Tax=Halorussus gelatinilyticus TaxID=2937524 RepID=A0A8U0IK84_9EURY|nr:hypothetical protein [Halorussus gelatinilyticus]UPW01086.1 hypothetical protein M0R88_03045 [Halorussus gelatinilyticus]